MLIYYVEGEKNSPEVQLDPNENIFSIKGNSFLPNPVAFYQGIIDWFYVFLGIAEIKEQINLTIAFNYLNTASSKQIARLLKLLMKSSFRDRIKISWYYHSDDPDMMFAGQRFEQLSNLKFEYIAGENSEPIFN